METVRKLWINLGEILQKSLILRKFREPWKSSQSILKKILEKFWRNLKNNFEQLWNDYVGIFLVTIGKLWKIERKYFGEL